MQRKTRARRASGFAALELIVVLAILAMVLCLLALAADRSRRNARLGHDIANLRQIGAATGAFASDNDDMLWGLWWQGSFDNPSNYSKYNDLNGDTSDYTAQASQVVDILRRVARREDMPKMNSLFANYRYSHLVLEEYLHQPMPHRMWVSSGDANRLLWANDPAGFDKGKFGKKQPPPGGANKRWPYSTSYVICIGNYDRSETGARVYSAGVHNLFGIPGNADLGPRPLADVRFPSSRVVIHDDYTWHFGSRQAYAAHEEAHVPMLFADGAAGARATADSNLGWQPNNPKSPNPTLFDYFPNSYEPPALDPSGADLVSGHFLWARDGLYARDFGGPEACTGQPNCGK